MTWLLSDDIHGTSLRGTTRQCTSTYRYRSLGPTWTITVILDFRENIWLSVVYITKYIYDTVFIGYHKTRHSSYKTINRTLVHTISKEG